MNKIEQEKKLAEIAEKYGLIMILLFGSRAIDNNKFLRKESDFDIAYLAEKNLNLTEETQLICDLMPIFNSELIDLANIKMAGPLLLHEIFKQHKILFCRDAEKYLLYQMYAIRKFQEAKPLFELESQYIKKHLKKL